MISTVIFPFRKNYLKDINLSTELCVFKISWINIYYIVCIILIIEKFKSYNIFESFLHATKYYRICTFTDPDYLSWRPGQIIECKNLLRLNCNSWNFNQKIWKHMERSVSDRSASKSSQTDNCMQFRLKCHWGMQIWCYTLYQALRTCTCSWKWSLWYRESISRAYYVKANLFLSRIWQFKVENFPHVLTASICLKIQDS